MKHGSWKEAYGYKFETKDRKIVISGDTAPTDEVVKACNGCDVLLHEVYNTKGEQLQTPHWKEYFRTFHTTPAELADIARRAHPEASGRISPSVAWVTRRGFSGADRKRVFGQLGDGERSGNLLR